ncbi:MAG: isochorismate synthase [Solirubrobacterales bacterium]|nr:isochorismate synthase [Solirubrobacterales bacterium]
MPLTIASESNQQIDEPSRILFAQRCSDAITRARETGGEAIASITLPVAPQTDPSAVVFASRRAGEAWFCFEQPERDGSALATLGSVRTLVGEGVDRFGEVAKAWRALAAQAFCDPPEGPAGSGLVAVGGFAFAQAGGASPGWSGYPSACLEVPEVALARSGSEVRLTLSALATPDDTVEELTARIAARIAELRTATLPLIDPAPAGAYRVISAMPPEHYVSAVERAVERIRAGELAKVVLAREVQVHAPIDHDPAAIFGVLREGFSGCYLYCVGRGDTAFLGASPELLVRREGQRASTVAIAGSARRSADPAVDDHLGEQLMRSTKDLEEQAIVVRQIVRTLRPLSLWVTSPEEPSVVKIANIQHLATPIRAQLTSPVAAIDLAGMLHPTPAVGAEPAQRAKDLIPALEGLDRGWYAGPVGWSDVHQDGEFCVALRCALLRGKIAACYAGVGVVRDSDPAAELAETELKLAAILPVVCG